MKDVDHWLLVIYVAGVVPASVFVMKKVMPHAGPPDTVDMIFAGLLGLFWPAWAVPVLIGWLASLLYKLL